MYKLKINVCLGNQRLYWWWNLLLWGFRYSNQGWRWRLLGMGNVPLAGLNLSREMRLAETRVSIRREDGWNFMFPCAMTVVTMGSGGAVWECEQKKTWEADSDTGAAEDRKWSLIWWTSSTGSYPEEQAPISSNYSAVAELPRSVASSTDWHIKHVGGWGRRAADLHHQGPDLRPNAVFEAGW